MTWVFRQIGLVEQRRNHIMPFGQAKKRASDGASSETRTGTLSLRNTFLTAVNPLLHHGGYEPSGVLLQPLKHLPGVIADTAVRAYTFAHMNFHNDLDFLEAGGKPRCALVTWYRLPVDQRVAVGDIKPVVSVYQGQFAGPEHRVVQSL